MGNLTDSHYASAEYTDGPTEPPLPTRKEAEAQIPSDGSLINILANRILKEGWA